MLKNAIIYDKGTQLSVYSVFNSIKSGTQFGRGPARSAHAQNSDSAANEQHNINKNIR